MFLENPKIRLRQLEPEDLDILYLWENDVNIWNVTNTTAPYSRYALKQYIENSHREIFETGQLRLMIEEKTNNKTIGTIDLFDFNPLHLRVALGVLVYSEENRRQGFAHSALNLIIDYCFNILHLHQVYCNVNEDNIKSIKMLTNIGFVIAGTKKQWIKTCNGWQNEILFQKINLKN
ncbi:MAG: GNAT family N-acetyltransferase [Prevotellaceae bacterium]|jgi:diamine N-acetyltransferase|nr:GNAT family N-acetyltransferase [Prevotellaceae bacterium]